MASRLDDLFAQMRKLDHEIELEINRQRATFLYQVVDGRVVFAEDVKRQHEAAKEPILSYLSNASPLMILLTPIIYSVLIPFLILDLFVTLYQAICFPLFGIEKARRSDFMAFERKDLSYLNGIEKVNSMYGSYANGLLAYAADVAGRSEAHWCPIRHARRMQGQHVHYTNFMAYGDAEAYQRMKNNENEDQ
ncbi:hypothetical protein [Sulfitobacter donghicola]|uniref:Uncharacterized protein n=1 Tax=Sulfitobacter donghicola DSW-25 = KCTC 12864 = JCM 14565 TaxID=1300350 RepID=A0A073IF68_9RHOB|nr:hypothetical protein [Sulfitobacter donghicola]KEJ88131.1 hypothetical protein DSW25_16945 [Sulfitobacter donghicola DSW-25 = KCTC 12864 = JCM 14565]KIN70066.1 hypothetical protein Z948_104 [Sulfitobacter donghicola DSW-25 = KCTC 12864 = JCM 14565]